jgi:hypothetical protein
VQAIASSTSGFVIPSIVMDEAPMNTPLSSLHTTLKVPLFYVLATAPSTLILALPDGGGIHAARTDTLEGNLTSCFRTYFRSAMYRVMKLWVKRGD